MNIEKGFCQNLSFCYYISNSKDQQETQRGNVILKLKKDCKYGRYRFDMINSDCCSII